MMPNQQYCLPILKETHYSVLSLLCYNLHSGIFLLSEQPHGYRNLYEYDNRINSLKMPAAIVTFTLRRLITLLSSLECVMKAARSAAQK